MTHTLSAFPAPKRAEWESSRLRHALQGYSLILSSPRLVGALNRARSDVPAIDQSFETAREGYDHHSHSHACNSTDHVQYSSVHSTNMTESDNDTDTSSSRSQARQSAAALTKDAKRRMASRRLRKSLQASLLQIFPFCENDDSFMADTLRDTYGYRGYVSEVDVRDRHDQLWRHPPSKSAEWWTDLRSGRSKFDDREAVENAFWADNNSLPGVDIDAPWSETVADRHAHVESRDVCSNDRYSRAIKQLTADLSDERSDSAIEHDPDGLLYLTFINLKNDCIPPSMRVPETRARVTARLARWNLAGSKTGLRSRHKSGASLSLGEETVKDLDSIWSTLCGIENRRRVKNREQWDDDRRLQSRTDRHIRAIDLIQPCSSGLS